MNPKGCHVVQEDIQFLMDIGILEVTRPFNQEFTVNMVGSSPKKRPADHIDEVKGSLVKIHIDFCKLAFSTHDHANCEVCSRDRRGCQVVRDDLQQAMDEKVITLYRDEEEEDGSQEDGSEDFGYDSDSDVYYDEYVDYSKDPDMQEEDDNDVDKGTGDKEGSQDDASNGDDGVNAITPHFNVPEPFEITYHSQQSTMDPLIICLAGPTPYESDKAVPYKYNATMIEEGKKVPIPASLAIGNIADTSGMTRSGRVFAPVVSRKNTDLPNREASQKQPDTTIPMQAPTGKQVNEDAEEILRLIRKSDYKVADQLIQTPAKISVLSLLLNSESHRNSLMKVLDSAFVDLDVTVEQFDEVVGNITACKTLSFSDDELPPEGSKHNLALHISIQCLEYSLSNVLVDTGSSLNVMPKTTLSSYHIKDPLYVPMA